MANSQQGNDSKSKKVRCWPARIMWIIGLLFILWIGGYTVEAIPTKPHVIPFIILWNIMLIAGFMDIIRAGREGRGGFISDTTIPFQVGWSRRLGVM